MASSSNYFYETSKYISFSLALISLFSAFFIFYLYYSRHHLRSFTFRMVVFLQISDSIISFSIILQIFDPITKPGLCIFQGFIINYGVLASFFWTMCISTTIYISAKGLLKNEKTIEKIFCIICFGLPILMTFIPLILNDYGDSGNWCWIRTDIDRLEREMIVIFELYFFIWLAMIYNSIIITLTFRHFKRMENALGVEIEESLKKIMYFPICQIILWSAPSIIRIFQMCKYDKEGFFLIHDITVAINGFANTILYALNNKIRNEIKTSFSYNNNLLINN